MSEIMIGVAKKVLTGATNYPAQTKAALMKSMLERAEADRRPGESVEKAFARFTAEHPDGQLMLKAHSVVRGPDWQPDPIEKPKAPTSPALEDLKAEAEKVRRADPKLTADAAFAKAYVDPANREKVAALNAEQLASYEATQAAGKEA